MQEIELTNGDITYTTYSIWLRFFYMHVNTSNKRLNYLRYFISENLEEICFSFKYSEFDFEDYKFIKNIFPYDEDEQNCFKNVNLRYLIGHIIFKYDVKDIIDSFDELDLQIIEEERYIHTKMEFDLIKKYEHYLDCNHFETFILTSTQDWVIKDILKYNNVSKLIKEHIISRLEEDKNIVQSDEQLLLIGLKSKNDSINNYGDYKHREIQEIEKQDEYYIITWKNQDLDPLTIKYKKTI